MATFYLNSAAGGSNDGTSKTNAWLLSTTAAAGVTAADDLIYSHTSAEAVAAATTITYPDGLKVMSANFGGSTPPVAADITAGAQVATTGNNILTISGAPYIYGIKYVSGSGANSVDLRLGGSAQSRPYFEGCTFELGGTANSRFIPGYSQGCGVTLRNCTVNYTSATQGMTPTSSLIWHNDPGVPAVTGTAVGSFIRSGATGPGVCEFWGLDLSAIQNLIVTATYPKLIFKNCKLHTSYVPVTVAYAAPGQTGYLMLNCTRDGEWMGYEKGNYFGVQTTEKTIVRIGGSNNGIHSYSLKVVTNSNASRRQPFMCEPELPLQNLAIGRSVTLDMETLTDGVTLTNGDMWVEVYVQATAGEGTLTRISSAPATFLTTATNNTTSTAIWVDGTLSSPVKQYARVTFTPRVGGIYYVRVFLGRPSTTAYVCYAPRLS